MKIRPKEVGKHCIFLGDCLEGLTKFPKNFVDLVVTSPPYNIGIKYNTYDDNLSHEEHLLWVREWAEELFRVLKDNGSFFLNLGSKPTDPWIAMDVARTVGEVFELQNTFHWIKSITIDEPSVERGLGIDEKLSVGHYKPLNSKRFVNDCHEYVFHFTKTGDVALDRLALGVPYTDPNNQKRWKNGGSGVRCRGNNWFIPYKTIQSRSKERPHPATFPVDLVKMCIEISGVGKSGVLLDPFLGLGTSIIAAEEMGLTGLGFEIDQYYAKVARSNIKEALTQESHLLRKIENLIDKIS